MLILFCYRNYCNSRYSVILIGAAMMDCYGWQQDCESLQALAKALGDEADALWEETWRVVKRLKFGANEGMCGQHLRGLSGKWY